MRSMAAQRVCLPPAIPASPKAMGNHPDRMPLEAGLGGRVTKPLRQALDAAARAISSQWRALTLRRCDRTVQAMLPSATRGAALDRTARRGRGRTWQASAIR
jgi:hypothetical protein